MSDSAAWLDDRGHCRECGGINECGGTCPHSPNYESPADLLEEIKFQLHQSEDAGDFVLWLGEKLGVEV